MLRNTVLAVILALLFSCFASAAFAGGFPGVAVEQIGTDKYSSQFVNCVLGASLYSTPAENGSMYILSGSEHYQGLGYDFPVGTDYIGWLIKVNFAEQTRIGFFSMSDGVHNVSYKLEAVANDGHNTLIYNGPVTASEQYITFAPGSHDIMVMATTVPEPSSVLALTTGFIGLGGFILRRRR